MCPAFLSRAKEKEEEKEEKRKRRKSERRMQNNKGTEALANLRTLRQGGRTWQLFVGGKNDHENLRQTRNYNFCDKCVVLARNLKFSNLTQ